MSTLRRVGIGSGIGALGGALAGASFDRDSKSGRKLSGRERAINGLSGAASYGVIGGLTGYSYDTLKKARHVLGVDPIPPTPRAPKYRKGAKHEASKRWGIPKKDILKEAMYSAFADELKKIANMGAVLGGTAGYMATPGRLKNKLIGAAVGAGAGHILGSSASAVKREVWDEPRAYERQQLYGYVPSGGY